MSTVFFGGYFKIEEIFLLKNLLKKSKNKKSA
jgi:hypothetical protein